MEDHENGLTPNAVCIHVKDYRLSFLFGRLFYIQILSVNVIPAGNDLSRASSSEEITELTSQLHVTSNQRDQALFQVRDILTTI